MTVGGVVECRMRSSRLPGKMLQEVMSGFTLLDAVVLRARKSRRLEKVVVATTVETSDDPIAAHCRERGYPLFRGSEDDVLARILAACDAHGIKVLSRLTGDNPFIDGKAIDDLITFWEAGAYDYACTTLMGHSANWAAERTFPRGVSMEVLRVELLKVVAPEIVLPLERQSPTFFIYDRPERFRLGAFLAEGAYAAWRHPELRMTVDTAEDLDLTRRLLAELAPGDPAGFSTGTAIALLAARPDLQAINAHVQHNIISQMKVPT